MKTFFVDGKKSPFAKVLCDIGGGSLLSQLLGSINKKFSSCFNVLRK